MTGIARFRVVALDCPEPAVLAEFYSALTGLPIDRRDGDWHQLAAEGGVAMAFQLAPDHVAPTWPGGDRPQQIHLDFHLADLDEGERRVLALGARKHDHQPGDPGDFRVFLDPAGHPFCLCAE
jgi:Glyoxalase-like domain